MTAAVGIDIGTSNTKVVRVERGVGTTVLNRATPAGLDDLLALVVAGLRVATEAGSVDAVGVASMAESGYPLDADGRALTPLLSWRDGRDVIEIRSLADRLGADALFEATGVRPGPKPSLAVWLWLRAMHPDTFAAMHRWAGVADAVHLALTGELRTDHTLAGRTLAYRLPPAGERLAGSFDADLLTEAGLRPDRLARVGLIGDPPSRVRPEVAAETGLRAGTPVVVAGHDHQVAAWASGVRDIGQVADSVGTAEAMLNLVGRVPDRAAVRRQGMSVVRTVDGSTEALLAGTGSAGGFLQWLADRHADGEVSDLLALDSAGKDALAGGGWLLPYPAGRQCPEPDPAIGVRLVGPPPAHLGVAALEAVSYQAQWVLDSQAALSRRRTAQLSLSGRPLHRSPLWAGIRATLTDAATTLTTVAEPVASGAALLALHRAGLGDEAPLLSQQVQPVDGLGDRYRERLRDFIASARQPGP
ncbi:MAG: FGGY family carbohydrate kinase [Micropruina sp.]|uniref:FGGY-family carbohydrate kinase n=1 Tax=Micropruina sp. TaxID=2737536 RepID=UPI0039E217C1